MSISSMTKPSKIVEKTDEEKLVAVLQKALDKNTGIIKKVNIVPLQADEPPIYISMAEFVESTKLPPRRINTEKWQSVSKDIVSTGNVFDHMKEVAVHSSGAALDETSSLWATVGEAFERYAMTLEIQGNEKTCLEAELDEPVIDVDKLILFTPEQYEKENFMFRPYRSDRPLRWGKGVSLTNGNTYYLPADMYSPYAPATELTGPLVACYSTGYAAGPDYKWAIKSGLCEVVERDSFMFYWLTHNTPPRLDVQALKPKLSKELQRLIDFEGVDISVHWLKTDVDLPSIVCFINAKRGRGFAMGASTNLSWEVAVEKAILEAYHTLNWTVDLDRWMHEEIVLENISDFSEHVRFYLNDENHHLLDFILKDNELDGTDEFLTQFDGRNIEIDDAIDQLTELGFEPLVVDRTGEDLQSIGIVVSCVVIPGMHPLHVGLGSEHRDTRRLEQIAKNIGVSMPESLNLDPHPFP